MSAWENIELYGPQNAERLVEILRSELGAAQHPGQAGAFILEDLSFHAPRLADAHISILSLSKTPLTDPLIEALIDHPELFADDILVR